jgi:type I restriction enzyme, S subunit
MKWTEIEIGKLVELRQGFCVNKKSNHLLADSGLPLLRITDMINGNQNIFIKEEISEKFVAKPDDIIFTRTGQVGLVFRNQYGVIHNNCFTVSPISNELTKDYLYWFLRSDATKKIANDYASGAAQLDLSHSAFKSIKIKYPLAPPTQHRIAAILSAYDDLIENNLKRIRLLEEAAAIAYSTEFRNYQAGNKEFISLPKGWSVKSIGEIYGKLESGSRPKGGIDKELKEGIASVGAENVIGLGKYNYQSEKLITLAFFENMNRGIIEDRDILIYKDGAYIGKTTLFQDGFPHEKCCVNEHVFLLTSKDVRYQYFLFFTLNQRLYFEKMQQLNANAAQPGINQESLKSLKLIWPSEDKIEEFNKQVETSVKLIFVLAKQNVQLQTARDILLPKLMNGQIEV